MTNQNLIDKYNIPGPRYTSYPTVPYWDNATFSHSAWEGSFQQTFDLTNQSEGISLYIHLPFCESLCTFCACNKYITKKHSLENPYIASILKEWSLYTEKLSQRPIIKEVHLGGGTPTFFSPDNLKYLLEAIFSKADLHPHKAFSFEGHPNNTTFEHLSTLYSLGFQRVSFGVQDYDKQVQTAINRLQPFEAVERVTNQARAIGYTSVSHDLVYGLPFQTMDAVVDTIEKTKKLQPDRIAFYSYAHVPWIKGVGQRGFDEADLPSGQLKRSFYEQGKMLLQSLGYAEIGMDHFALAHDEMFLAMKNHSLHRNFMGYTASKTSLMIGLGVSSISDSWTMFAQNEKKLEDYQKRVAENQLPIFRGHRLSEQDLIIRKTILDLICNLQTEWHSDLDLILKDYDTKERLQELEKDKLIVFENNTLLIKEEGRPFLRNVCMAFDLRLLQNEPSTRLFSMTV